MTIADELKAINQDWRIIIRDSKIAERMRLEAIVKEEPPYIREYKNRIVDVYQLLLQENYSQR